VVGVVGEERKKLLASFFFSPSTSTAFVFFQRPSDTLRPYLCEDERTKRTTPTNFFFRSSILTLFR
jgi:hypothetical protein